MTSWCRLPPFPAFLQTGQSGSTASRKNRIVIPISDPEGTAVYHFLCRREDRRKFSPLIGRLQRRQKKLKSKKTGRKNPSGFWLAKYTIHLLRYRNTEQNCPDRFLLHVLFVQQPRHRLGDQEADHCGDDHLRQQEGEVIDQRVDDVQRLTREHIDQRLAPCEEALLGEEPLAPDAKEDGAGDDVRDIAEQAELPGCRRPATAVYF